MRGGGILVPNLFWVKYKCMHSQIYWIHTHRFCVHSPKAQGHAPKYCVQILNFLVNFVMTYTLMALPMHLIYLLSLWQQLTLYLFGRRKKPRSYHFIFLTFNFNSTFRIEDDGKISQNGWSVSNNQSKKCASKENTSCLNIFLSILVCQRCILFHLSDKVFTVSEFVF